MKETEYKMWKYLVATLLLVNSATSDAQILATFKNRHETDTFNHLAVDENSGRVYVGAVNRIYQLSENLDLEIDLQNGPDYDSPECSSIDCTNPIQTKLTDNVNKALVIDANRGKLISCGTLRQGICHTHNLANISDFEKGKEPVVANSVNASTVAFIAPGPPKPESTRVLYVGVTYTGNSPYRSEVPAVASRSLEAGRMFFIAEAGVTTGTRIYVNNLSRERYLINYIYGFSSDRFSYFLTTQMKTTASSPYISKLARVCHEDSNYYSYAEVPIECIDRNGRLYNLAEAGFIGKSGSILAKSLGNSPQEDVLYAVFSQSEKLEGEGSNKSSSSSALCVYSVANIKRKFMQNIQNCFNGKGARGLDYISPSHGCTQTKIQTIDENFCGLDVNTPLGGEIPVQAVPLITYNNSHLSSVAAATLGESTVVFIGTSDGKIKKLAIEDKEVVHEYEEFWADQGSAINANMFFDKKAEHVYVMSEKKVSKVRVQNCEKYENCWSCLNVRDPYCGWCSAKNKCSPRAECDNGETSEKDQLSWIPFKSNRCTSITSIMPKSMPRSTARTLELTIDNLPSLTGDIQCVFQILGKTHVTAAQRTAYGVNCSTPPTANIGSFDPGMYDHEVTLSVRTTERASFVQTSITLYDCEAYQNCYDCTQSIYQCDWCTESHVCSHDTADRCRNDVLITSSNAAVAGHRSGPTFCPMINMTTGSSEILIHDGSTEIIPVKAYLLGNNFLTAGSGLICQFNIQGHVHSVGSNLSGDTLYCNAFEFTYESSDKVGIITAAFAVLYTHGKYPLDNPQGVHLVLYNCKIMAENCGVCLALDEKYKCGWCQGNDRCTISSQCAGGWLKDNATCPNPKITSFWPPYSPWSTSSNVTIDGINLGLKFEDIQNGIRIAGVSCMPYREYYIKSKRIVCEVDGPGDASAPNGPITVQVNNFRATSLDVYSFVTPEIRGINPTSGPKSGGTLLSIVGKYMNAGSSASVHIGPYSCVIISREKSEMKCLTTKAENIGLHNVEVMLNREKIVVNNDKFEYANDPIIDLVDQSTNSIVTPKSIPAGGLKLSVHGKDFMHVQSHNMYVYYNNTRYYGKCNIDSNSQMTCYTPATPDIDNSKLDADRPLKLEFGFEMDGVESVQNVSSRPDYPKLLLYPNPEFSVFKENDAQYKAAYLTINGQNIDRAATASDVTIFIDSAVCNVTSLARTQLNCKPPENLPNISPGSSDSGEVSVHVGINLKFSVGKLNYASSFPQASPLTQSTIYGAILGIVFIFLVFISFMVAYRRKSTESNRVLKNMQEQMDILELRVAAECKEAFAELQTEITDLTSDITSGGIPFLEYRYYVVKVLFPDTENHEILLREKPDLIRMERGLRLFGQLLLNKTFLLLFIRTLESNRYFSMKDRVNVASMIMVTLQSKMEYCTDILKTLLAELIEKCMEGNSHPKLLLRRTESVAEKMLSAWFTFLLYKFLRECAGEPLYMLFRAVKQQVDKGPVDAITSEARYSLSEEKLIRQSIDYTPMVVYVTISQQTAFVTGLETNTENVPVKVLDCDTISQVKEKSLDAIYRATPFSQRPSPADLDVEWRTGMSGRLILYDEDSTTKNDGEWKKVNTLHHYRVPDGGFLSLVSVKQASASPYNISMLTSDRLEKLHKYETLNLAKYHVNYSSFNRSLPSYGQDDGQFKRWHLVKHHESGAHAKEGERSNKKMVSEIYLTRLLATKGTLQKFVDDLFETIFSTAHRGSVLPLAIKYMFDFLDDQALQHGITDPEVVHTWKSNSLPLRFWVNVLKNPNFVFDISKSNIVDSCLSVIAQTFMDSCSTSDHRLGKDSPSSKLLYAKDIPIYKEWVDRYYSDIKVMGAVSDQDMNSMLAEESRSHSSEFNYNTSLYELYLYAAKYNEQLIVTLEEDEFSQKQKLSHKLEQVHGYMAACAAGNM